MNYLDYIAKKIDAAGIGVFDNAKGQPKAGRNIFVGNIQDKPDTAIFIFSYGGVPPQRYFEGDKVNLPNVQIRVRSNTDVNCFNLLQTIEQLIDGTTDQANKLLSCQKKTDPASIGKDEKGRYEATQNYVLEIINY